jgi:hypothetical protein
MEYDTDEKANEERAVLIELVNKRSLARAELGYYALDEITESFLP